MATSDIPKAANPAEPKMQPLIGSVTRGDTVIIAIGPELQQHHVHEALLSHHSEYFRNAFNGSWKESNDKRISLADVDPIAFDIFVQWLYTQKLPPHLEYCKMARSLPPTVADDDKWITALTKSLVFGDRFLIPVFCQAMNNFIVDSVLDNAGSPERPPPFFTAAKYAFENLPEDHAIHEFFIEVHCRYWEIESDQQECMVSEVLEQQIPPALLVKIMVRYAYKASGEVTWCNVALGGCHYHMHVDEEEREQCMTCMTKQLKETSI